MSEQPFDNFLTATLRPYCERTGLSANEVQIAEEAARLAWAVARTPLANILTAAWMYDNKPHHLYSAIRQEALRYEVDDEVRDDIVRLMDAAYAVANLCARQPDREIEPVDPMKPQRCECDHPNHRATSGCPNMVVMHRICGPCQAGD